MEAGAYRMWVMGMLVSLVGIAGCSEQVPEVTVPAGMVHGEQASPSAVIRKPHVAQGCNLETVNGQPVASLPVQVSNGQIALSGWIAGQIDERGVLVGQTSLVFSASPGPTEIIFAGADVHHREDVARSLGEPALSAAGFEAVLDGSKLSPGTYALTLKRGSYACAQSFSLQRGN